MIDDLEYVRAGLPKEKCSFPFLSMLDSRTCLCLGTCKGTGRTDTVHGGGRYDKDFVVIPAGCAEEVNGHWVSKYQIWCFEEDSSRCGTGCEQCFDAGMRGKRNFREREPSYITLKPCPHCSGQQ